LRVFRLVLRSAGAIFLAALLAASAPAKDVVVASFNLENYLRMERKVDGKLVPDAPKPEAEITAVIETLQEIKPDILGVIEMGDASMLDDFQSRLKAAGLDYPHREQVEGADPVRHIALLSRFPIVARSSRGDVKFELNGTQQRMSRGILDVSVQISDHYRLHLVGAHLKSKRQIPEFDEKTMRAKEASLLKAHLDNILTSSAQEKLMLFGDLNDTKNEYPVRELVGPPSSPCYMKDLFLTDRYGYHWTHFWAAADIYSRIDYLLVSRSLLPDISKEHSGISSFRRWYKASDHRAIFATIVVPES